MRTKKQILVLLCGFALVLGTAITPGYGDEKPKKPSGKEVFEQKCLKCHKPAKFTTQHHDRAAWEQILNRMELNSCILTDAESKVVADYLVKEHGD